MKITIETNDGIYGIDLAHPLDISIPVTFDTPQIKAFGCAPASKEPYRAGSFTGDVRLGGSCNCEIYSFSPHLHGTHTECVGHITAERLPVHEVIKDAFIPATLVTVTPETTTAESYIPPLQFGDQVISAALLEKYLSQASHAFLDALIIRTAPNDPTKKTRDYSLHPPAFFTNDAMRYINSLNIKHLIVDLPSVDKADDGGKLTNHRIFWADAQRTITELAFIPETIIDGHYLLNLQVAAMAADAAPSRPVLFKVAKK